MTKPSRSLLVVTLSVTTVLAALAIVGRLTGPDLRSPRGPHASTSIPMLVTPPPTPTTLSPVVARITFRGDQVGAVAESPEAVWVAHGCTLSRVDPHRNRVVATVAGIPRRGQDCAVGELAVGAGVVWALTGQGLARIDAQTNRVTRRIRLPVPSGLAVTATSVWVGCCGPAGPIGPGSRGRLARIDPAGGQVVATIGLAGLPGEVGAGPSGVWVTGRGGPIWRVDPTSGRLVATIRVPGGLGGLPHEGPAGEAGDVLVGRDAVWVSNPANAEVLRIDPRRNQLQGRAFTGGPALVTADGAVWGTSSTTLVPLNDQARREVPLGELGQPDEFLDEQGQLDEISDLAAGPDAVWVAAPAGLFRVDLARLH
jgi:hypothetical protein